MHVLLKFQNLVKIGWTVSELQMKNLAIGQFFTPPPLTPLSKWS